MSNSYSESSQFANPCAQVKCIIEEQYTITSGTYFQISFLIWFIKVAISFFISSPSTRPASQLQKLGPRELIIYMIFFSTNILLWPINLVLDIYALVYVVGRHYTLEQIIFIIVGF